MDNLGNMGNQTDVVFYLQIPRREVLRRQRVHRHGRDAVPETRARGVPFRPGEVGRQRPVPLWITLQLPGVHRASQAPRQNNGPRFATRYVSFYFHTGY